MDSVVRHMELLLLGSSGGCVVRFGPVSQSREHNSDCVSSPKVFSELGNIGTEPCLSLSLCLCGAQPFFPKETIRAQWIMLLNG
jgi:hypothetical protein